MPTNLNVISLQYPISAQDRAVALVVKGDGKKLYFQAARLSWAQGLYVRALLSVLYEYRSSSLKRENMSNKILIVEDEKESRELLATFLKVSGYAVITANDGLEALKKAKAEHPDIIISDICMPVLDGIEMVKTLRNFPEFRATPIIMMTALNAENLISGMDAGANEGIRKPINLDALLKHIKHWLAKPKMFNKAIV
jgi:CheY-like chemotaxis protein